MFRKIIFCVFIFQFSPEARPRADQFKAIELDLKTAEHLAIVNNFELSTEKIQRKILSRKITENWREFWPLLNLSYRRNQNVIERAMDDRLHQFRVSLSQSVYDGGRTSLALELSKLDVLLNNHKYRILRNKIILNTRNEFFKLIQLKENVSIKKKSLERSNLQLKQSQKGLILGSTTKMDYLEVKGRTKQIEAEYLIEKRDLENAILKFKQLLLLKKNIKIKIQKSSIEDVLVKKNQQPFNKILSLAYKNRPEIDQSKVNLLKARKEFIISKRYFFPKISINANYDLSGNRYPPLEKGWGVGIVVSTNLYGSRISQDGQLNSSNNDYSRGYNSNTSAGILDDITYERNIIEKNLNFRQSRYDDERSREDIYIEVKIAYDNVRRNFQIYNVARERENLVWERLLIESLKTRLGDLKRIDYMLTEIEYRRAALAAAKAKTDYVLSVNNLEYMMGVKPDFLKLFTIKRN